MSLTVTQHIDAAGSNTSPYNTWATAATTISAAAAAATSGAVLAMGSAYSETISASGLTINVSSTAAAPYAIISGTKGTTSGVTDLAVGATITCSNASNISLQGFLYCSGVNWVYSSNTSSAMSMGNSASSIQTYDNCSFIVTGIGSSAAINFGYPGAGNGSNVTLNSCNFKFGATGQRIDIFANVDINGGSLLSGGTSPSILFSMGAGSGRGSSLKVNGLDLTNAGTSMSLADGQGGTKAVFSGIKLPTGWTGTPISSSNIQPGQKVELYQSYAGSTFYRFWLVDYERTVQDNTTIYMTGGLIDGTTNYSVKMTTTASHTSYPNNVAIGMLMTVPNTTTGTAKTITIPFVHDSTTALKDDEIYIMVRYYNSNSEVVVTDATANAITTSANQATSAKTWTTTGMTNPNAQELSVSITPGQAGPIYCMVCMTKPGYTIYHDSPIVS